MFLVLLSGCVTFDPFQGPPESPPSGAPCRVVVTWRQEVYFTPDPTRGGEPIPGIVGRLYLFGKDMGHPLGTSGSVIVDLYECHPSSPSQPILLEEWRIDKETLARLMQRDGIGWGYTLFLPWSTYRPDRRHVQLRTRFEPEGGVPLYADIAPLQLRDESTKPTLTAVTPSRSSVQPAGLTVDAPKSQSFNLSRPPAD